MDNSYRHRWGSGGKPRDLPPLKAPTEIIGTLPRGKLPEPQDRARDALAQKRLAYINECRLAGYRDKEIRESLKLAHSTFASFISNYGAGLRLFRSRQGRLKDG